jgi:hypothetical protein
MDVQQPFFRARGAIAEMCGLYLQLSRPFFRSSKLRRQLMHQIHGPAAVFLRHRSCLLQQCNDGTPGVICHDIGVRLTLCHRRKWDNRGGPVGYMGAHHHTPLLLSKVGQELKSNKP